MSKTRQKEGAEAAGEMSQNLGDEISWTREIFRAMP